MREMQRFVTVGLFFSDPWTCWLYKFWE